MEINNQIVSNINFNEISAGCIKLKGKTVTGEIRGNKGKGKIEFINCKFPNGIKIIDNECEIIIKTEYKVTPTSIRNWFKRILNLK